MVATSKLVAIQPTRNEVVAGGAVLGALSMVLTLLEIRFPFFPIPYLMFEFAEIPVIVAAMMYGPAGGAISAFEYWVLLQMAGRDAPIGPALKFLAVGSTVLGVWCGGWLHRKLGMKPGLVRFAVLSSALGVAFRVAVMTAANWYILAFLFPGYLTFAKGMLGTTLGMTFADDLSALAMVLVLTAAYNVIQMAISVLPSLAVCSAALAKHGRFSGRYWLRVYAVPRTAEAA